MGKLLTKQKGETAEQFQSTIMVGDASMLGGKSADTYYNLSMATKSIVENTSIYDYTDEGRYISASAVTATLTDLPKELMGLATIFELVVEKLTGTRIMMTIKRHNNEQYYCTGVIGGAFNDWQRVAYTDNISNPNLLVNGDFRVNQRGGYYIPIGITAYSDSACTTVMGTMAKVQTAIYHSDTVRKGTTSSGLTCYVKTSDCKKGYIGTGYGVDMWYSGSSTLTVTKNDNSITLSSSGAQSYYTQKFENIDILLGKTLTWTVEEDDGTIYSNTTTVPLTLPSSNTGFHTIEFKEGVKFIFTLSATYMQAGFAIGDGKNFSVKSVKVELGNVATPLSPRPYAEELALCQRYLYIGELIGTMVSYTASSINFFVPLSATLRNGNLSLIGTANDTTYTNGYLVRSYTFTNHTGFTFEVGSIKPNGVIISATKSSHGITTTNPAMIQFFGVSGISAEL